MIMKKPKFWDNKNIISKLISFILLPFTIPIIFNNFFFNFFKKFKTKRIISICVGNIYLGGTGKTPTAIKLFEILSKFKKKIVIGKKFYQSHNDEILLLKKKTKLLVGKSRLEILNKAIKNNKDIIIFDDGLQDRNIYYNIRIVCFDALSWIGNGYLIPSGPLREKLNSIKKFDAVFIKNSEKPNKNLINTIKKINPKIKIFNSKYKILNINKFNLSKKYIMFSGIGNPNNFSKLLKKNKFKIISETSFPDHYNYKKNNILKIINKANKLKAKIITTEKDYVKIPKIYQKKIDYLNIDLEIDNQKKLIDFLKSKIYA